MVESESSAPKDSRSLKFTGQHSRPLRLALAAITGLSLSACLPNVPRESSVVAPKAIERVVPPTKSLSPDEIDLACTLVAYPRVSEGSQYGPAGLSVGEKLVKMPNMGVKTEPINSNIVIRERGGGERRLTNNPDFDDNSPVLSPDGKRVAFVRRGPMRIVDEERNIFEHEYTGKEGLYTINVDGSNEQRVTVPIKEASEYFPLWRSDGNGLIFVRQTYGDYPRQVEIFNTDQDGTNLRRLAHNVSMSANEGEFPSLFFPKLSPDGKLLAYRDWNSTYVVDAENGRNTRLVSKGASIDDPEGADRGMVWMPDSKGILVVRHYRVDRVNFGVKTYVFGLDGVPSSDLTPICANRSYALP